MNITILQPSYSNVPMKAIQSLEVLNAKLAQMGHSVKIARAVGCSLICHVRSRMATDYMNTSERGDVSLWLDSDMVIEDGPGVARMCEFALEAGAIVGAAYATKQPLGKCTADIKRVEMIGAFSEGQLYPAESVGFGCVAIPHDVYRQMSPHVRGTASEKMFAFFERIWRNGEWLGEDVSFCRRASELSVPVYCDTRVRAGHLGQYEYHLEDLGQSTVHYEGVKMRPNVEETDGVPPTDPTPRGRGGEGT